MQDEKRQTANRTIRGRRRRARTLAFERLDVRAVLSATGGHIAFGGAMNKFEEPAHHFDERIERGFDLRGGGGNFSQYGLDDRGPWINGPAGDPQRSGPGWYTPSYAPQPPIAYVVDADVGQTIVIVMAGGPLGPLWFSIPTMSPPASASNGPPPGGREPGPAPLSMAAALGGGRPSSAPGDAPGGFVASSISEPDGAPAATLVSLGNLSAGVLNATQAMIARLSAVTDNSAGSAIEWRADSAQGDAQAGSRADDDLADPNGGLIELDTPRDRGSTLPGEELRGDALRPRKGLRLGAPSQVDPFWDEVFEMLAEDEEPATEDVAKVADRAIETPAIQQAPATYDEGGTIELAIGADQHSATGGSGVSAAASGVDVEITMEAGVALYQAFEMLGVPVETVAPPAVETLPAEGDAKAEAPAESTPHRAASAAFGVLAALPFALRRKGTSDESTRWWRRKRADRS
jgi:hypothetical protein